jgi:hypothetical protein
MHITLKAMFLTTALGFGTVAGAADQPASPHDHSPAATAAAPAAAAATKPAGMMGGMMDMDTMRCMGLSEERLATLKVELNITDRQLRAWNAYAAAARAGARPMAGGMDMAMPMPMPTKPGEGMQGGGMMMPSALPDRLAHHEMMMKAHLKSLQRLRAAVSDFYAVLTPEQRSQADKALCGGMG